jgi:dTDP-4-amino-4,6-dideoxygalactose transaminase
MIRLTVPSIEEDDLAAVREALASGFLVQGPRVAAFEEALAKKIGAAHCVAVSNCTSALQLALMALGAERGDAVLVSAYSWIATANVIELCGAEPIFVDVDPATFNMSPSALEAALAKATSSGKRVRAILPVHAFGQMADVDAIMAVADAAKLPVIEDAACALGATWRGKQAGTVGAAGCFSFHPRKAITTGEGGAVVTHDAALANRVKALRNHGQDPTAPSPDFVIPGFNMRLTEMQAALGATQLAKLDRIVAARRRLAARYTEGLAGSPISAPHVPAPSAPVYQSYVATLPAELAPRRADIIKALRDKGVETTIGTWHMPMTTFFRKKYGFREGDFPGTDAAFERALTLPLYESMTDGQVDDVLAALRSVTA